MAIQVVNFMLSTCTSVLSVIVSELVGFVDAWVVASVLEQVTASNISAAICIECSPWPSCQRRWLGSLVYIRTRGPSSKPSYGAHCHGPTQPTMSIGVVNE